MVTNKMETKRITNVDFTDSLDDNESFFINKNNSIRQISKDNALSGYQKIIAANGGTSFSKNKVIVSNNEGKLQASSATSVELEYLSGTTSNVQKQLNSLQTNMQEQLNSLQNQTWSLDFGTPIANNTDLDTLTTINNYYSPTTNVTKTLLNCPFSAYGFSLKVYSPANNINYIRQEITTTRTTSSSQPTNSGYTMVRHGIKQSDNTWRFNGWAKVSMFPTLTGEQKRQLVDLMDEYYRVCNTLFYYTGSVRRESYANASGKGYDTVTKYASCTPDYPVLKRKNANVDSDNPNTLYYKYMLNCGLFCQMIWMGRPISDFLSGTTEGERVLSNYAQGKSGTISPTTAALTSLPTITTKINSVLVDSTGVWGYYFNFDLSKKAYGAKKSSGKFYNYNSYYQALSENDGLYELYPDGRIPLGFDGASSMAEELYRMGCEIPREEMDIGDLVFYRADDISDEDKDANVNRAFRNISHVGIVYDMVDGEPTIMECTNVYDDPYALGKINMNGDTNSEVARSAFLHNQTVMVARHPVAYGKGGNVPSKFTVYRGIDVPQIY